MEGDSAAFDGPFDCGVELDDDDDTVDVDAVANVAAVVGNCVATP